jgi:hypothetical protein
VVAVRVTDQNDLRIGVFEAQRRDALFDQGHILLEIRVDQDIALWRIDQVYTARSAVPT